MADPIRGIHHVTSISGDAQRNVDFYVSLMGLRLVKRTVNFDDPGTYHLYYGDGEGSPGSILTFFPWAHAAPGSTGAGATAITGFSVPEGALRFWQERFEERGVEYVESSAYGIDALHLADPDGMQLEIVESDNPGTGAGVGGVPSEVGIGFFEGVTLESGDPEGSARVLTDLFGYEELGEVDGRRRYRSPAGDEGAFVDVLTDAPSRASRMGRGSVHHVAFRVKDEEEQLEWRFRVAEAGIPVTEILDRQYFRSIYFREPGGILYEIATDPPGFTWDEDVATLGTELKLPPWLEPERERIRARLPELVDPETAS